MCRAQAIAAISLTLFVPAVCRAQTEGAVGLARDVFARKVIADELTPPSAYIEERLPLPDAAFTDRIVRERVPLAPTAVEVGIAPTPNALPARIVERPILEERVVAAQPALRWWEVLTKSRYGYYDDAYFDDNWYYDYYESPAVAAADDVVRYRTTWFYAPTAERGLFSW